MKNKWLVLCCVGMLTAFAMTGCGSKDAAAETTTEATEEVTEEATDAEATEEATEEDATAGEYRGCCRRDCYRGYRG